MKRMNKLETAMLKVIQLQARQIEQLLEAMRVMIQRGGKE